MTMPEHRILDVRDVMVYAEGRAANFRVRTTRDVLPGGLSAAMAPLMIDWKHSDVRTGGGIVVGPELLEHFGYGPEEFRARPLLIKEILAPGDSIMACLPIRLSPSTRPTVVVQSSPSGPHTDTLQVASRRDST